MSNSSSPASVIIPLTALKCLYRSATDKKVVCEIDMESLKEVNEPVTLDDMVAQAHLEYATGATKGFESTADLIKHLER